MLMDYAPAQPAVPTALHEALAGASPAMTTQAVAGVLARPAERAAPSLPI